jgi:hypothetical protein
MKSCYSILKFVNNPLSDESIAIGLIAISGDKIYFSTSLRKIAFSKILNKKYAQLLDFSLRQFDGFIASEIQKEAPSITVFESKKIDFEYLNRLSKYHNGILQFTKPNLLNVEIDDKIFNEYYEKFIIPFDEEREDNELKEDSLLQRNLLVKVYAPLKNKIDIDYTIHKEELPTLFFDFNFDAIGVNGSIYALKAIDINAVATSNPIQRIISEYESIIDRLNEFANKNNIINNEPSFYLMMDKYTGNKQELKDLYEFISRSKMPRFELLSSAEGDIFSKIIINKNARKLSKYIHNP